MKEAPPEKVEKEKDSVKARANSKPVPSTEQQSHEECWSCKKFVSIQAFLCKCGFSFCKKHRLPENHSCSYDFKEEGIRSLRQQNPKMETDKVEKI